MKNIFIKMVVTFFVLMNIEAIGQRDNGTSTNPSNPIPSKGVGSNLWDWTSLVGNGSYNGNGAMYYKINPNSSMYQNYSTPPIQGDPIGIESPYYNSSSTQLSEFVAFGTASDYKWSDGWELITRNFGYASDEITGATSDAKVPYFILYNKFSGNLRVFGVLPSNGGGGNINSVTVELKFLTSLDEQNNPNYKNYNYSALLGVNGGSNNPDPIKGIPYGKAQALDMPTTVNNLSKICAFTGYNNEFFYADFSVGYDPCSCWNEGGIQVSFYTNITGSITLSGRFIGTGTPIADLVNGENSIPDPVGYLAGVYTQGNNVQAGALVYKDLNTYASQIIASETNNTNTNPEIINDLKGISIISDVAGKVFAEYAPAFETISALSDYAATSLTDANAKPSTATIIQGEMTLKGSLNLNAQNPESFIKFTLPGTPSVVNAPEFYTASNPIPNYPKYNEVLGPFALLQTPSINVSEFNVPYVISTSPNAITNNYYRDEFQMTDPIKYIFNPSAHVNLTQSVVLASLELEYIGLAPNPSGFPYPNGFTVHGATWNYTSQLSSNLVSMHYTTDYIDPSQLSNLIIAVENSNGYAGTPSEFNVYLKLLVNIVSNDLKDDGVTPNQSILMFTYPITVYNEHKNNPPNLTGFPLTITSQTTAGNCDCAAPENLTINTINYTNTFQSTYPYTNYAWDNFTISGAITTANSGIQVQYLSYDGQVYMQPGSSIGPGISIAVGHKVFPSNPNTGPWTGTGNLQSWCAGVANSNLPNTYKGNTLGSNIQSTRISELPNFGGAINQSNQNSNGSLSIYPNPLSNASTIKYSIPVSGNVELVVYDLLGVKQKEIYNGYKNSGKYDLVFQSDDIPSGVYIVSIKAKNYTKTERIVISR